MLYPKLLKPYSKSESIDWTDVRWQRLGLFLRLLVPGVVCFFLTKRSLNFPSVQPFGQYSIHRCSKQIILNFYENSLIHYVIKIPETFKENACDKLHTPVVQRGCLIPKTTLLKSILTGVEKFRKHNVVRFCTFWQIAIPLSKKSNNNQVNILHI